MPAEGRSPLCLGGGLVVVADARIDGRSELLRRLADCGHQLPATASDAELVGAAFRAWGEECPGHLLGDFAFAVWDARERRLFCARDHFGVKPFYYARAGDGLVSPPHGAAACARRAAVRGPAGMPGQTSGGGTPAGGSRRAPGVAPGCALS